MPSAAAHMAAAAAIAAGAPGLAAPVVPRLQTFIIDLPPQELPPHPVHPSLPEKLVTTKDLEGHVANIPWQSALTSAATMVGDTASKTISNATDALMSSLGGGAPAPAGMGIPSPSPVPNFDHLGPESNRFWHSVLTRDLEHRAYAPEPAAPGPAPAYAYAPGPGPAQGKCGANLVTGRPSALGTPAAFCPYCRWCCACNSNFPDGHCETSMVAVDAYGGPEAMVYCSTCKRDCSACPAYGVLPVGNIVRRNVDNIDFTASSMHGAGGGCPNGNCCDSTMPQPLPWMPAPAPGPGPAPAPGPAPGSAR